MLQMHRLISKIIYTVLFFGAFSLVGCKGPAVLADEPPPALKKNSLLKVLPYSYESVWRAAQLTLKYPIAVNNMENGILETEWIRGVDGFLPPKATIEPSAGMKYKITLNMVKGKLDGRNSVRVTITKKIERQKDFFSDVETLTSDGYEEKVIAYRIEREILIEEALKKAAAGK